MLTASERATVDAVAVLCGLTAAQAQRAIPMIEARVADIRSWMDARAPFQGIAYCVACGVCARIARGE